MLHAGEEGPEAPLAARLDAAYYELTRTTARHFGRAGEGWFLTGVAGLDASTMNRAVIETADATDVERVTREAAEFFGERQCSWSVVLPSFRSHPRWHNELVMRGYHASSTLDVLVRAPEPIEGPVRDAEIRLARPEEAPRFTEMLLEIFRMPRRFYPALLEMTEAWRQAGARLYFAEQDGAPVATALLSRLGGVAGVYNVGTLRQARRQGFSRALMARLLADAKGADVVTLQVAPEGFVEGFYLGLGFEQLYHWRFYSPRASSGFFRR